MLWGLVDTGDMKGKAGEGASLVKGEGEDTEQEGERQVNNTGDV